MERRIVQNSRLLWLDEDLNEKKNDLPNSVKYLHNFVNTIDTFVDADKCIDFLTELKDVKVWMIVSDAFSQTIVPHIHDISEVNAIFVFSNNKTQYEQWAKLWPKVKGVYTKIDLIGDALKAAVRRCDENSIPISFVPADVTLSKNLDELDPSFMYTQILKEIVLEINFNEQSIKDFSTYCREQFAENNITLEKINKFEREYQQELSVWWYTTECFVYSMLNRALRTLEVDTIIKMAFFLSDLHRQIEKMHLEQTGGQKSTFIVYRGQGLSKEDFEKLMQTKGGLMSFNNFLSTSRDRDISFIFAESNANDSSLIGILFEITIDPTVSTAPFALISGLSNFQTEEEILFSMHTVFRIGEIRTLDQVNGRLWQVELKLTNDNDPLLNAMTERLRIETQEGSIGWDRLGKLLFKLGQADKAEQIYQILLEQKSFHSLFEAYYYHQLGYTKCEQGDYISAIQFYEKAIEINESSFDNHPNLFVSYSCIGSVYFKMGYYSKALLFYQKALEKKQKYLPSNHADLAISYSNIGSTYNLMDEYPNALFFYEKTLQIYEKTLVKNHPNLATCYNNIGSVYNRMGEPSKALSFYTKALDIREKILPANHPDLAASHDCIGVVYNRTGEYLKALLSFEKAFGMCEKTRPENHPDFAQFNNNIGLAYNNMGQYSNALLFHSKALEIGQQILPGTHPDLAEFNNNIGLVYHSMDEFSTALLFYEKSLEIYQKTLPAYHMQLVSVYSNIGLVCYSLNDYPRAVKFLEHAMEICQHSLPANHAITQSVANSLEFVREELKIIDHK